MSDTPTEATYRRRPYAHIFSIKDLMRTASALGSYFFSLDTMRWFSSRVSEEVRVAESVEQRQIMEGHPETEPVRIDVLFITSERNVRSAWDDQRKYTLRRATIMPHPDRSSTLQGDYIDFELLSQFGEYKNLRQAKKRLRRISLDEWSNSNTMKEVAI